MNLLRSAVMIFGMFAASRLLAVSYTVDFVRPLHLSGIATHWDEYYGQYTPGVGLSYEILFGSQSIADYGFFTVKSSDGSVGRTVDVRFVLESTYLTRIDDSYLSRGFGPTLDPAERASQIANFAGPGSLSYGIFMLGGGTVLYSTMIESLEVGTLYEFPFLSLEHSGPPHGTPLLWDDTKPAIFGFSIDVSYGLVDAQVINVPEGGQTFVYLAPVLLLLGIARYRRAGRTTR